MLIDCFTFFNEYDILKGRLRYLYDVVDKFVIVEADHSFAGKPKPFNFPENSKFFADYLDKIIFVPFKVDTSKYDFDTPVEQYDPQSAPWQVEYDQRNHIQDALHAMGARPEDIVLISDVDEIPSKQGIRLAMDGLSVEKANVVTLMQQMYVYNFRNRHRAHPVTGYGQRGFPQTVMTTMAHLDTTTPQALRENRAFNLCIFDVGGWHLSYWMTPEMAKHKIESFAHQEANNGVYNDLDHLKSSMERGKWLFDGTNESMLSPANPLDIDPEIWDIFAPLSGRINHYYHNLDGWFSPEDASLYRLMVQSAQDGYKFVEVGSYRGRSSAFMAVEIANSGKRIDFACVDIWVPNGDYPNLDKEQFDRNMRPLRKYHSALAMSSTDAAKRFKDASLDFVFIDADHAYESVKADIAAWLPKVRPGGFIGGHDQYFEGVNRAVVEAFGHYAVIGTCWVVGV